MVGAGRLVSRKSRINLDPCNTPPAFPFGARCLVAKDNTTLCAAGTGREAAARTCRSVIDRKPPETPQGAGVTGRNAFRRPGARGRIRPAGASRDGIHLPPGGRTSILPLRRPYTGGMHEQEHVSLSSGYYCRPSALGPATSHSLALPPERLASTSRTPRTRSNGFPSPCATRRPSRSSFTTASRPR